MSDKCCINVFDDGPLGIENLDTLTDAQGEELEIKSRMALCRCGGSQNMPFCDGTHKKIGFTNQVEKADSDKENDEGRRSIRVFLDGPYEVSEDIALNINDEDGVSNQDPYYLCRCGASENKPFCDGSHKKINFSDE
ncbi:MAG: CDGSH iron-sulfur domain-containing protein [Thermodesulfobacteriota bacterium]